ncbi:CD48 antigen-like [Megalobrama amblycephala]|uniref:CD48 antigen-like n=1 Tax=Megalobrama amblycephala TaxID=75352 RepID=UPI00201412EF|nr:CD48 antigen-like [Megalobrama amblycephala]
MIFQYNLILMFLCGFAALSVSTETCGKDLLVGTSCIMKLRTKNNEKPYEIKWTHDRNGKILHWRDGNIKTRAEGVFKEEDGSLRFQSVSLKDTGTYTYTVTSSDGTEIGKDNVEIKVHERVPKPTVKINCTADGNAALSCDVGNSKDPSLTVSWYEDGKLIQNEIKPQVFLSSTQVQENKTYSCETHNPVSKEKSESVTVSCKKIDLGDDSSVGSGVDSGVDSGVKSDIKSGVDSDVDSGVDSGVKFGVDSGVDFDSPSWIMVSILASGGALLLLII